MREFDSRLASRCLPLNREEQTHPIIRRRDRLSFCILHTFSSSFSCSGRLQRFFMRVSEIVLNNMLTAKCEVPSGVAHPFVLKKRYVGLLLSMFLLCRIAEYHFHGRTNFLVPIIHNLCLRNHILDIFSVMRERSSCYICPVLKPSYTDD